MATVNSSGTLTSSGLGSGLDVNSIVGKLMEVEAKPLTALATKEASYQARISAFGTLKGAVSALQSSLSGLLSSSGMRTVRASLVDSTIASVSAGNSAVAGSYSIEVEQLAQANKLASTGYSSLADAVGSGTLTFSFGTVSGGVFTSNADAPAKTVTIAEGQNSLAGIRDAVNAAGIGVTATIVNDGGTSGNRLVFTSTNSGASYALKVSADDDDGTDTNATGLSSLSYDPATGGVKNLSEKVAAQDSRVIIDGITVTKSSNTLTDAIQGVTLTLSKTNDNAPTTLAVTSDASGITSAVQGFVKAYNDLVTSISTLTKYDAANKKASVLTGDAAPRLVQTQVRAILGSVLSGEGLTLTTLSQAGLSFSLDGTLSLNSGKLSSAIASDAAGVSKLFAAVGAATDSRISVSGTTSKTVPGSYAVSVSQLATQGKAVGTALTEPIVISAGVNDSLTVSVNGTSATVTLDAGSYATAAALAAQVQSKVNGASAISTANASVTVSADTSKVITFASSRYGSDSAVSVSGTAVASIFGSASPTVTAGVDVAGTIGGFTATGTGQLLTGLAGSATEGLQLLVSGSSTGSRGQVNFTQGFAPRLNDALAKLLDSSGPITAATDSANKRIEDIADRREALQARLEKRQATLLAQFRALDTLMAKMNGTSAYLTQQLANLPSTSSK